MSMTARRATAAEAEPGAVQSPPQPRSRSLSSFANWSVRTKLIAILVLPVAAACAVGAVRVGDLLGTASAFSRDEAVSQAQRATVDLVRELGKEQVVAVADVTGVGSETTGLPSAQAQHAQTDAAAAAAGSLVAGLDEPTVELRRSAVALQNALGQLVDIRANATSSSGSSGLTPAQVVRAYDGVANTALTVGDSLVGAVGDEQLQVLAVSGQSLAATNLAAAKEDGLVLAATAAGPDAVAPAELRTSVTDLAAAFSSFQTNGSAQQQSAYAQAFAGEATAQRTALFTDVLRTLTSGGTPGVSAGEWLSASVPSAQDLATVQRAISDDQVATAQSLRDDTRARALRETVLVVVLLLLGFGITYFAVRSVLRPLRVLRADAMEIAQRTLPEEIQRLRDGRAQPGDAVQPVGVSTREEIGQVARAFDAVHAEALRLAAEQEQLRRNVNEIFVNLSRRSQGLVERQLALIDRLENEEQDPDQLSQLFRLDHLAARMRRNNDNLLVLAGSEGSRGVIRPMAVIDVVRAAVSETDQYERVIINPTPSVTVDAATAKDLVHLLAELLDNATVFSSPTSSVTVAVSGTYQEGLVVEVYDKGLGIPAPELADLNRKLAEAPVVDAQVPRQMGLFVVSRLASRHDMQVELRPSAAGAGTVAAVWVPPAVLVSDVRAENAPSGVPGTSPVPAVAALPRPLAAPRPPVAPGPRTAPGPIAAPSPAAVPSPPPVPVPVAAPVPPPAGRPVVDVPAAAARPLPAPTETTEEPPGPAHPASGPDESETTPIFAEVSAWFTGDIGSILAAPAATGRSAGAPRRHEAPAEPIGATVHEFPRSPQPARQPVSSPAAATTTRRSFDTAADAGWRAVQAAMAGHAVETTQAGLPKRRPRANLVPGSASSDVAPAITTRPRNAEAVRGRLSSYQRGLQSGRQRTAGSATGPAPDASATDSQAPDSGESNDQELHGRHKTLRDDERRYAR